MIAAIGAVSAISAAPPASSLGAIGSIGSATSARASPFFDLGREQLVKPVLDAAHALRSGDQPYHERLWHVERPDYGSHLQRRGRRHPGDSCYLGDRLGRQLHR